MTDNRYPLTPSEYHAATWELLDAFPLLYHTSGYRPGDAGKHGWRMADDYGIPLAEGTTIKVYDPWDVVRYARDKLMLWGLYHNNRGSVGRHLHFQGLPPRWEGVKGEVPMWWIIKYAPHRIPATLIGNGPAQVKQGDD